MGGQSSRLGGPASSPLVATSHGAPTPQEPAVRRVTVAPASPEALLFSGFLGACTALLALLLCGYGPGDVLMDLRPVMLVIATMLAATWYMNRDTGRVLVVLRRGFLLGALEWAALLLRARSDEHPGGMLQLLGGRVAAVLVVVCLLGWVACLALTRSPYGELGNDRS